ncbi:hypothetical protein [Ureibacillus sinduriensis]|uniref:Uncharacterized protein n=1 Tax=Ureibacillus sinduriensis BLB-1 = JCM 15800 TaxID=1384057 RepID=A0A0A3IN22_9BACL|nr:hypothetical protein [Ureibacillus sinduriensis]KGR76232.1 hypothetical protein CD33_06695 [Ureibacillus sinduriensis BLB-1 = JCM 15800]
MTVSFLENVKEVASLVILLSCVIYRRQLKLTKWRRKLSKGEMAMYVITSIVIPVYAITYLLLLLGVE